MGAGYVRAIKVPFSHPPSKVSQRGKKPLKRKSKLSLRKGSKFTKIKILDNNQLKIDKTFEKSLSKGPKNVNFSSL